MEKYFIFLPSSVNSPGYQNTISNYTTILQNPLYTKNSVVGLKEAFIPNTVNNIDTMFKATFYFGSVDILQPSNSTKYTIIQTEDKNNIQITFEKDESCILQKYVMPLGHYENVNDFCERLKNTFPQAVKSQIFLKIDSSINRIYLKLPPDSILAWPASLSALGKICGFNNEIYFGGEHTARYEPLQFLDGEFNIGINIIPPQIYGEKILPILATLPKKGRRDDILHYSFLNPQFFPVNKDEIRAIEVSVLDDKGKCVNLQKGQVIVVVEFRNLSSFIKP